VSLSLQLLCQTLQGKQIAGCAKAADLTNANGSKTGVMAKDFPGMDVREVNLDRRNTDRGYGIA
jgi:hypothetical protein